MVAYWGEIAGLITAICWTFTGLSFEFASKRIGSLQVNIIRLFFAFFVLGAYTWISRGMFFPYDASGFNWGWLAVSGIIGFTIGDLLLFQAFETIGARISLLIMSFSPPFAALISYFFLDEVLSYTSIIGMFVTIIGIAIVILERGVKEEGKKRRMKFKFPVKGLLFAFGGSIGQAVGLIFSKFGMQQYNAFAATQIRVLAGLIGFIILFFFMKRWRKVFHSFSDRKAIGGVATGSFFGPFLGVSFSLIAVKHTQVGIASTLMSLSPILIIPLSAVIFKEKIRLMEIVGALVAFAGISLFFI